MKAYTVLPIVIIVLLVTGIFFRFANLDAKVYWGDETVTSLRISGYTLEELQEQALRGEEMSVEELQKYQYPNQEKGVMDTVKGLAAEEPQHPPLYYVLARLWVQQFGNSVLVTRSFSAFVSLFAFLCIYWLCRELFTPLVGWIAVALLAVSPFHVLYAQEARSYSLWTVTILLSSAALLRAIRRATFLDWGIYAITLAMGFYTILLSGIVVVGHGIYVIACESFTLTKTVKAYILSTLCSILIFVPWILTVLASFSEADETTSWTKARVPLKSLVRTWLLNLSRLFVDFNYSFVARNLLMYLVIGMLLILVSYALYFVCRNQPMRVWLFVITLIGPTTLALVLPDLILGGIRSSVARYVIPCYLGIEISVAYLLATKLTAVSNKRQYVWRSVALLLLCGGVISCAVSFQAEDWWNKYNAVHVPELAHLVNQADEPVFVTSWHGLMAFSHVFDPTVRFQPLSSQRVSLSPEDSAVFVHNSSTTVQNLLQQHPTYRVAQTYKWKEKVEPVYETQTELWKLTQKN